MQGRPEVAAQRASERGLGGKLDERSLTARKPASRWNADATILLTNAAKMAQNMKVQGGVVHVGRACVNVVERHL